MSSTWKVFSIYRVIYRLSRDCTFVRKSLYIKQARPIALQAQ